MKLESRLRSVPNWGKVMTLITTAAGLGVLASGSGIVGDNPVRVQEPLTIESSSAESVDGTTIGDAIIFNDQQSMILSAPSFPGESYNIEIVLKNQSGSDQNHRLEIAAPDGFRFSAATAAQGTNVAVAQETDNKFVFTVDSDDDDTGTGGSTADTAEFSDANNLLTLKVEVLPQVLPGFYALAFTTEAL